MEGRNIASIRKGKGMTQEELAQLLSTTTVTLSRWENGHFEPKASTIKKLCEILCCTESELLNGSQEGKVELESVHIKRASKIIARWITEINIISLTYHNE